MDQQSQPDDDLDDLINKLSQMDLSPEQSTKDHHSDAINASDHQLTDAPQAQLQNNTIQSVAQPTVIISADNNQMVSNADYDKFFDKYWKIFGEIHDSARNDRAEVQTAIDLYKQQIDEAIANNTLSSVPRAILEKYPDLLSIKSSIIMNVSKMTEVGAKLISATKPSKATVTNIQNNIGSEESLSKILEEPLESGDDY